jgi:hypothetical protein
MYALNEKGVPISRSRLERIVIWWSVEYRYARAFATLRFAAGTWDVFLGILLCSYGYYWGAALLPAAVLLFWLGYRLTLAAQAQTEQGWNRRNYRAHIQTAPTPQHAHV